MKTIYATTLLGLSILLFGCGGGGGGGSSSAPVGQTPPPTTPTVPPSVTGATGVWEGTFTDTGTYAVIGLIRGGQARIFSAQEGVLYEGPVTVNGTNLTATLEVVDAVAGHYTSINLTGTVVTGGSINGTYTDNAPGGVRNGSFSLTYDAVTERGASLATTDANWSDSASSITLAIDATGDIAGADTAACVYNGTLAAPDPAINVYDIAMDVSSCGINGSYTGFAAVTDTAATNDTLLFVASTATMVIFGELNR